MNFQKVFGPLKSFSSFRFEIFLNFELVLKIPKKHHLTKITSFLKFDLQVSKFYLSIF